MLFLFTKNQLKMKEENILIVLKNALILATIATVLFWANFIYELPDNNQPQLFDNEVMIVVVENETTVDSLFINQFGEVLDCVTTSKIK